MNKADHLVTVAAPIREAARAIQQTVLEIQRNDGHLTAAQAKALLELYGAATAIEVAFNDELIQGQ